MVLDNLSNVQKSEAYFLFNLLYDQDDNKFVDLAISSKADYIITHDNNFNRLQEIEFPKVHCLTIQELKEIITPQPNK